LGQGQMRHGVHVSYLDRNAPAGQRGTIHFRAVG
jgi:hypothetical protein